MVHAVAMCGETPFLSPCPYHGSSIHRSCPSLTTGAKIAGELFINSLLPQIFLLLPQSCSPCLLITMPSLHMHCSVLIHRPSASSFARPCASYLFPQRYHRSDLDISHQWILPSFPLTLMPTLTLVPRHPTNSAQKLPPHEQHRSSVTGSLTAIQRFRSRYT